MSTKDGTAITVPSSGASALGAAAPYIGSPKGRHGHVFVKVRMLNDIYNQRILELAGNIPFLGRLDSPQATARAHSKLCGSTVVVELTMTDGRVSAFAQDVKACALGQAAASIVGRHVLGATVAELCRVRDEVRTMLKENGAPPSGAWTDAAILEPVRDYKARHASTLLAFEATAEAATKALVTPPRPDLADCRTVAD